MSEIQSLFYLSNVLKNYKLDKEEVAKLLFPNVSTPNMSLRRVLKGNGKVTVDQLEILAQYTGVSVPTIYMAGCNAWSDYSSDDSLVLTRGIYEVVYIYATSVLTICTKDGTAIFDQAIDNQITMHDLMDMINSIIEGTYNYK